MKTKIPNSLNPRGKKFAKSSSGQIPLFRLGSPLAYIVLLLVGFLLFRTVFQDAGVRKVAYSEFKEAVEKGQFERVQLANDWVKGFLPENTAMTPAQAKGVRSEPATAPWLANRVAGDTELVKLLDQKHVPYEAAPNSAFAEAFSISLAPPALPSSFSSFFLPRLPAPLP